MSQTTTDERHPLLRVVDGVEGLLDSVRDSQVTFLSVADKEELLVGLERQVRRLEALRARAVAGSDDVAAEHGVRSAGAWLAHRTRHDGGDGRAWQRLAEGLDERWPVLRRAYDEGAVSTEQVAVVGIALDELPADLAPELREKAERHLVAEAEHFAPRELRALGRKVLEVVAPDVAEHHEARLLEREEQRAWERASLTHRRIGGGTSRATLTMPDAAMDRLLTTLHAFTSPRRSAPDDRRPYPTRLAHAFMSLLERVPADWLPQHGGTNTQLVVTIDASALDEALATAHLTTGTPITVGEARRLACGAGILPAVLDGRSRPLDLGRTRRFFNASQRRAMDLRDHGCTAEGCDTPAAWCEAHHLRRWSRGGRTDLRDGVLLCSFHHHRAHDRRYELGRAGSGGVTFHRRS